MYGLALKKTPPGGGTQRVPLLARDRRHKAWGSCGRPHPSHQVRNNDLQRCIIRSLRRGLVLGCLGWQITHLHVVVD